MRAWSAPEVPQLPVAGPAVALYDTASGSLVTTAPDGPARLYVCGITPYDATHIGHAATYVGFDLLNRAWRNAGHQVVFVENVTDVDDPLLERAAKVNVDWTELAERETELFRQDMQALRVLPPDHYVGAVESIPLAVALIERLQEAGSVYRVEDDHYFSVTADPAFGQESNYDRDTMLEIYPERGGDPDRPGKKDPLDCVVWRGPRDGEPHWDSPLGPGRPGWHIECAAIAREHLGVVVRRAGRRQRPGLPAPRDVRRPRAGRRSVRPVREGLQPRRDGGLRRREDVEVEGQPGLRLGAAQQRRRPDGDPAGAAAPPLPLRLGVAGQPSSGTPSTPWPTGGAPCRWAPVPRPRRSSPRCWPPWPTTSTPRARWPRCRAGWTPPSAAPATWPTPPTTTPRCTIHALLDAALGLAL